MKKRLLALLLAGAMSVGLAACGNSGDEGSANTPGAGICVEKAFQPGGDLIRGMGVRVESLARIKAMSVEGGVEFC